MNRLHTGLFSLLALAAMGCSFHARSADNYRKDTRKLLETRNSDIRSCYDAELEREPGLSGVVVLKFTVEAKTGKIVKPTVVQGDTTAPETLSQCVVKAIDGLALQPPDERTGDAEYTWEFETG